MMQDNDNDNDNDINIIKTMKQTAVGSSVARKKRGRCHQVGDVKYKKAPQAPKRFKSSYIFYSTTKHKDIRANLSKTNKEENAKVSRVESSGVDSNIYTVQ
jgi:hypothetical protein